MTSEKNLGAGYAHLLQMAADALTEEGETGLSEYAYGFYALLREGAANALHEQWGTD